MAEWFYSKDGQTKGAVSIQTIVDMVLSQELDINDYVMTPDDGLWKKIQDLPSIMNKIHEPSVTLHFDETTSAELLKYVTGESKHNLYFYIPIRRYILMNILTMGLYQFYWWHKQWTYWASKRGVSNQFPTRGFISIFREISLLSKIQYDEELNKVERADFNSRALLLGWFFIGNLTWMVSCVLPVEVIIPEIVYWGDYVLASLIFLPVQYYINRVNAKSNNDYATPGGGHYVLVVFGILAWVVGIFIAIRYHAMI